MKVKKQFVSFYWMLLLVIMFVACNSNDDPVDVDGKPPVINLIVENIKTEPGREFRVKAQLTDQDGIESVHLYCKDLYLDKTIHMGGDSLTTNYLLDYKFSTEKTLLTDRHEILLSVKDLGGRITKKNILVTMDGDFTAPFFSAAPDKQITVLLKTMTKIGVRFKVEDNKALDTVFIQIPMLNFEQKITTFTNDGKSLDFSHTITVPNTETSYDLEIIAIDKQNNRTVINSQVDVMPMPNFSKMYLVDVEKVEDLNTDLFGVPMLIQHVGEFSYRGYYYCENAGQGIRFAPQKTDFSPICFGIDPSNLSVLTDDWEISQPIILPSKGYYEINFNTKTGTYSTQMYSPSDTPVAIGSPLILNGVPGGPTIPLELGLVGSDIPGTGANWDTNKLLPLKQDPNNPYLFSVEMDLEAEKQIEFVISPRHSWGWWPSPFWRWTSDLEINVPEGGDNMGKLNIKISGKYIFKFDSHLKRSKLYLIN